MAIVRNDPLAGELEAFYESLELCGLQPLWTQNRSLMPGSPLPAAVPWRWEGETLRDRVAEAGRLVSIDRGGDRRVLALANPGLGGRPFATATLWGAVQYLGAGEGAPAHRHSQSAIRFVLEGTGVWTTVDGDACEMSPGDLVLTPAWTWHDHRSGSDGPMLWFDGLDMPLVAALDAPFFEIDPSGDYQEIVGRNLSLSRFSKSAGLAARALPPSAEESHSPQLIYRWEETDRELARVLGRSPSGVASLAFVSPASGRALMPTLGCGITRIRAGAVTPAVRVTGSSICVVWAGRGHSVVGGLEISWSAGDMFVVPSWLAAEHHAEVDADLFSVTDRPALEALGLYREAPLDDSQVVTGTFDSRASG